MNSLTLSQQPPSPFRIFPHVVSAVFAKIAIQPIYPPFVQIPMYLWKKNFKNFAVKKSRGRGGVATTPPPPSPERGGNKSR